MICSAPYRIVSILLILITLGFTSSICQPGVAQLFEAAEEKPNSAQADAEFRGTITEVKGEYVKVDLSGKRVSKDIIALVVRGPSENMVGSIGITTSNGKYTVGKIERGDLKVGDVVLFQPPKAGAKSNRGTGRAASMDGDEGSKKSAALAKKEAKDVGKLDKAKILPSTPFSAAEYKETISRLANEEKLTEPGSYELLRNMFARRFESNHKNEIAAATSNPAFKKWLEENITIKEELYLAIDPEVDNIPAVLNVFQALLEKFPDKIQEYGQLAIATAVVWDNPNAIYKYKHHQTRAKSPMPKGHLSAMDNFQFLVETEDYMEGRIKYVPWEFLKHIVNHSTPLNERQWAAQSYLRKRVNFGSCYKDVPYDDVMLATGSKQGNLNGHDYTLPNIAKYGGVCAHQADYACRVGKSIGVAAEYVRGPNAFGDYHAWVMWVELKSATKNGISFSLESYGRYNQDKYYVGQLIEPQSGKWITDRDLELRLHAVGMNTAAKRQSDLVMAAYQDVVAIAELDVEGQVKLIEEIIKLCPGNQEAWKELSLISTKFASEHKRNEKRMLKMVDSMFVNFKHFPDFTWKMFENMIEFEVDPKKRNGLYARLLALYFSAERPDLAMEARLKLTDELEEIDDLNSAIEGLAATILAFPGEGRYVPKMLDRIDDFCNTDEMKAKRAAFYVKLLPVVPKFRGSSPSKYCIALHQRAASVFEEAGNNALATAALQQAEAIKTAKKPF